MRGVATPRPIGPVAWLAWTETTAFQGMTMLRTTAPARLALGLFLLAGSGAAQAAVTGTGGGPESAVKAPHTRSSGQTVPSGGADLDLVDPTERTERQRRLDRVLDGICSDCR